MTKTKFEALSAAGLDRDTARRALEALGENVDDVPIYYRLVITIEGPELAGLLTDRLTLVAARDDAPMIDSAAARLDLREADSVNADHGLLTLTVDVGSAGVLDGLSLVEQTVENCLERLGLERRKAELVAGELERVRVDVTRAT